ncbi:hypothetical protein Ntsu_14710 [Nocardia sp. IFM 10818]
MISGSTRDTSTNTAALRTIAALAPPELEARLYDGPVGLPAFIPGDQPTPAALAEHASIAEPSEI